MNSHSDKNSQQLLPNFLLQIPPIDAKSSEDPDINCSSQEKISSRWRRKHPSTHTLLLWYAGQRVSLPPRSLPTVWNSHWLRSITDMKNLNQTQSIHCFENWKTSSFFSPGREGKQASYEYFSIWSPWETWTPQLSTTVFFFFFVSCTSSQKHINRFS